MILGLCLVSVAGLIWLITAVPAKPARRRHDTAPAPRAALAPRDLIAAHPERATWRDLSALLRASVSDADADRALDRAAGRGLPVPLLWSWADRYGGERLVLALDAEVAERSMRRHLTGGTVPDWKAMGILAALAQDSTASMPADELLDPDAAPTPGLTAADLTAPDLGDWSVGADAEGIEDLDLGGFGELPPIAGPAHLSAPSREWDPEEVSSSTSAEPPPAPRMDPPHPHDHGPWPLAS